MDGPRMQACENNHLIFKAIHAAFLLSTIGQINHHQQEQRRQKGLKKFPFFPSKFFEVSN